LAAAAAMKEEAISTTTPWSVFNWWNIEMRKRNNH
jgi:hypothetical protein